MGLLGKLFGKKEEDKAAKAGKVSVAADFSRHFWKEILVV